LEFKADLRIFQISAETKRSTVRHAKAKIELPAEVAK
jgi:hypothetical protein